MSMLDCPLCGKSVSMRLYDPSDFALDIYAHDVVGKGKGKGFRNTNAHSILGNSVAISPVKNRLLDLMALLRKEGIISEEEFQKRFGLLSPKVKDGTDNNVTEDDVTYDDSTDEGETYDSDAWERYADGLNSRITNLVNSVAEALDRDLSDEGETAIDRLESGVDSLIDDYNAFVETESEEQ